MNMEEYTVNAKSAEALIFVNIGDNVLDAKSAETLALVDSVYKKKAEDYMVANGGQK